MLSFNLHEIFKARQIERPYSFLVKAGISPQSATKIINSDTRILRLDHIEKLCLILHCEPNDLLVYKPDSNSYVSENHPLNKLISNDADSKWQEKFKTLPLSQLKEISRQISDMENV